MGWVEAAGWSFYLGIMETAALVLCTWYFLSHAEQNLNRSRKWKFAAFLFYGFCYRAVSAYTLGNPYQEVCLLMFLVFGCVAIGHWLYNNSMIHLLYDILFPVSIFAVQVFVSVLVYSYSVARWGLLTFDYYTDNIAVIVRILSLFLLTGVWMLFLNRNKYEDMEQCQFAGLFLPPLFSAFIIISLIIMGNVFMQMYGAFLLLTNILFLVLMNLYIFYLFSHLSKNRKLKNELELRDTQREMQYRHYETIEKKYMNSRKLIHDMRNHLQAMEALYQSNETEAAKAYGDGMRQMLSALTNTRYTENRMLNLILNDKAETANEKQVDMIIEIGELHLEQINDIDITTIFANLLDNALEAAQNSGENKYIRIKAAVFHEFSVVKIVNSISGSSKMVSVDKQSDNQKHMGLGLENVKAALHKYGGGIKTENTEQEFKVSITIPIPEQRETAVEQKEGGSL